MNNRQFVFAQIGKKHKRQNTVSMLLNPDDLLGSGWNIKVDRSWRVGKDELPDESRKRANQLGLFAAMRTIEQENTSRWIYIKLIPMMSSEDALLELPQTHLNLSQKKDSIAVLDAEKSVPLTIEMGLASARANELTYSEASKIGVYRYVVGTVEHVIVLICCSGLRGGWSWQDIKAVTTAQADRIRSVMASQTSV